MTAGPKPVTIRDVARRAGVSTATVSRALRGGAGVEPATQTRVEQAARELHYRPSGIARSLKLRATQTIGLIVTDIENPFFPHVVRAVEDAARDHGYAVILANGRRDPDREIESLEVLARREVDGLLVASSAITERHTSWFEHRPCPVVMMNCSSPVPEVPTVLSDNPDGGRLSAQHLLALGHRRVVYIGTSDTSNFASEERLAGMRASVAGHEAVLRIVLGDGSVEAGEQAAGEAIARWPEITALACYNDLTAVGALRGLRSLGLRVPADLSVVGFDDIELAPYTDPPLTTIRQGTDDLGRWAVRTLVAAIEAAGSPAGDAEQAGVERFPQVRRIPVELIVRHSTGPAPGIRS